jgi:hypothetical protein
MVIKDTEQCHAWQVCFKRNWCWVCMMILFNETILVKQMDASKEYTDGFMKRIDR